MLELFEFADAGTYNEVVLDAGYFSRGLPHALEAIYYHKEAAPAAAALATALQRAFARRFGKVDRAPPPVVVFDRTNFEAPFAEVGS